MRRISHVDDGCSVRLVDTAERIHRMATVMAEKQLRGHIPRFLPVWRTQVVVEVNPHVEKQSSRKRWSSRWNSPPMACSQSHILPK